MGSVTVFATTDGPRDSAINSAEPRRFDANVSRMNGRFANVARAGQQSLTLLTGTGGYSCSRLDSPTLTPRQRRGLFPVEDTDLSGSGGPLTQPTRLLNLSQFRRVQAERASPNDPIDLRRAAGADDRSGDGRVAQGPGDRNFAC